MLQSPIIQTLAWTVIDSAMDLELKCFQNVPCRKAIYAPCLGQKCKKMHSVCASNAIIFVSLAYLVFHKGCSYEDHVHLRILGLQKEAAEVSSIHSL